MIFSGCAPSPPAETRAGHGVGSAGAPFSKMRFPVAVKFFHIGYQIPHLPTFG